MATPAAVLSTLVKVEGLSTATRQMRGYDTTSRKAASGADKMTRASSAQGKTFMGTNRHLSSTVKTIGGLVGAYGAYRVIRSAISDTSELAGQTLRLSTITGMSIKQASTWIEVFKARGVQTSMVSMGFVTLAKNMRNAANGSKTAGSAFKELGIPMKVIESGNMQEVLLRTADAFVKMKNPAERAALAQSLFGRNARSLITILSGGRQAVLDSLAAAQRYGAYLPQNTAQLKAARNAQFALNYAMDGAKIAITTALMPYLLKGAQALSTFVGQMHTGQGAGGQFASAVATAFNIAKSVISGFINMVGGIGNAVRIIIALAAAFAALRVVGAIVAGVTALKSAWAGLNAVWAASPLGRIAIIVGVVASALAVLFGRQHQTAVTAREVAGAWDTARAAADRLANSNIGLAQAKLDLINAQRNEKSTQQALTQAVTQYGPKSTQAKDADLAHRQAQLDLRRATVGVTSAEHEQTSAKHESTKATQDAKTKEWARISTLQKLTDADREDVKALTNMRNTLAKTEPHSARFRELQDELRKATEKLNTDQGNLNKAINAMPGSKTTDLKINIDYLSDVPGAVSGIAKWIGQHAFASGGVVNKPMALIGEEAPRHPEVVVATNPAYRRRNVGLWATAGSMLGIPGFAAGGIPNAGRMVSAVDPYSASAASNFTRPIAKDWLASALPKGAAFKAYGAAEALLGRPYVTGGFGFGSPGLDCSGYVSTVMNAAGLMSGYLLTGGLKSWGEPGKGKYITVGVWGADSGPKGHTMMEILGTYFESGGGGGGPHIDTGWSMPFQWFRHPPGLAKGGIYGEANRVGAPGHQLSTEEYKRLYGKVPQFFSGGIYTASNYTSPQGYPGFAELSNNYTAGSGWDFSALGNLARGYKVAVNYGGRQETIPKIDVGRGGAGLAGHKRAIDLNQYAASAINFPFSAGLANVVLSSPGSVPSGGTPLAPSAAQKVKSLPSKVKPVAKKLLGTPNWLRSRLPDMDAIAQPQLNTLARFLQVYTDLIAGWGREDFAEDYVHQLSDGTWIIDQIKVSDQIQHYTDAIARWLTPAAGTVIDEVSTAKRFSEMINKRIIPSIAKAIARVQTRIAEIVEEIKARRREIERQKNNIARWERTAGNRTKIEAAKGLIKTDTDRIDHLMKILGTTDATDGGTLRGRLGALLEGKSQYAATGQQVSDMLTRFDAPVNAPDGRIANWFSVPAQWKEVSDALNTAHRAMATLQHPDVSTGGGIDLTSPLADLSSQISQTNALSSAIAGAQSQVLQGFVVPGLAKGGLFARGGLAVVGEKGPEVASFPTGARVYPNDATSVGGPDVRVIVEDHRTRVFVDDVEQKVNKATRKTARRAGRNLPGGKR